MRPSVIEGVAVDPLVLFSHWHAWCVLCHAVPPLLESCGFALVQHCVEFALCFVELLGVRAAVDVPSLAEDVVAFFRFRRVSSELAKARDTSPQVTLLERRGISCG